MNNITLGKVLKAMYKLSGKTLTQLSDETDLTVDTINNLFYARIQKPGLAGVNSLVNAMGFSIHQLMAFLTEHPDLPEACDVTEMFTKYIDAAEHTEKPVPAAKESAKNTKENLSEEIRILNEEHEKQLDRFKATHQRYSEQLQMQHNQQIEQMQAHEHQMELQFDKSISVLKETYAQETERIEKENTRLRKMSKILSIVFAFETFFVLLFLIIDMINRSVGWFR